MREKVTLSEKYVELVRRADDDEDEPAAPDGGGGFDRVMQLATSILRIGAAVVDEIHRSVGHSLWSVGLRDQRVGRQQAGDGVLVRCSLSVSRRYYGVRR